LAFCQLDKHRLLFTNDATNWDQIHMGDGNDRINMGLGNDIFSRNEMVYAGPRD
jgi:hypothetical protein